MPVNCESRVNGSGTGWQFGDFAYTGSKPGATDYNDFLAGLNAYNSATGGSLGE